MPPRSAEQGYPGGQPGWRAAPGEVAGCRGGGDADDEQCGDHPPGERRSTTEPARPEGEAGAHPARQAGGPAELAGPDPEPDEDDQPARAGQRQQEDPGDDDAGSEERYDDRVP